MRNPPDALMLFAAGFGTRMGALTRDTPKPLVHVAGRPLIDHALALAEATGVARIVVNAHYRAEMIADHLAGRNVHLSLETPQILDTGGGLRQALPLLNSDPVYTLNSDAVWQGPNPLTCLAEQWDPARMDALLLLVPTESALGHKGAGDFSRDPQGRLTRGPGHVYCGTQILRTGGLDTMPEGPFSLNLLWSEMALRSRLFGAVYPGRWCDVGHPEGLDLAGNLLAGARDV